MGIRIWMLAIFGMLALSSVNFATISNDKQIEILMQARQADLSEYCYIVGVCVEDKPALDPRFTSLRVAMCIPRTFIYEGRKITIGGMCFANFADLISVRPLSHMNRAWEGIRVFNSGNEAAGRRQIDYNLLNPVVY